MDNFDLEAFRAAGLYDPDAPEAGEVANLLWFLTELGWTPQDIASATNRVEVRSLAHSGSFRPPPDTTLDEAASEIGIEPEELALLRRTVGLDPGDDGPVFDKAGLEAFRGLHESSMLFSPQESHHFARVLGSSLARIADAAVSLFLIDIEGPLRESGATEFDVARVNLQAVGALDGIAGSLDPLLRLHLQAAIERSRAARDEDDDPYIVRMAVGFVDLVGFTPFSDRLSSTELGRLVRDFEDAAYDTVSANGGRVVKLIGDEVMYIAVDPQDACACVRALMQQFEGRRIDPRGGLAYGELLTRGGDYYGSIVNLASRIGDLAVPREVLATPALAERCPDYSFEPAGRRQLKGFDDPVSLVSLAL